MARYLAQRSNENDRRREDIPMLAYVDPLSGSVILQVALAGIPAAAFTFKSWWGRVKELGRRGWRLVRGG
jgi:hypothetical protein